MTSPSSSISSAPSRSLGKDFVAGFLVFLIALPLCLGIAMASGFPPAAGVLTAIVGGVVVNFLGSAQLTIKGPAVGLIVVALGAVTELGHGDMMAGYRYALAVGVVAAVIQIVLALVRAGWAGAALPPAVVHGMLAAIGISIIAKQAHTALGVAPENQATLALLFEIPSSVVHANPEIALIGLVSLVILFGFPLLRRRVARLEKVPAPIVVLLVAVALGYAFDLEHAHYHRVLGGELHIGPEYLVHLPGSRIDAIALPDFSQITSPTSIKYIVMFALVGSIESTLSVIAVDTLDPAKRASNLNRDLLVVGVGNLLASAIGGLPMISEIVRSKANIEAGATSRFANFFHGLLMLGCVASLPMVLQHVPLAALAAMLVYVGSQLVAPTESRHTGELGWERLVLFLITLFATLATDLLIGVGVGLALKVGLDRARGVPLATLLRGDLQVEPGAGELRLVFRHAATFSSLPSVQRAVERMPEDIARVIVDVRGVKLVDHTFLARVRQLSEEWPHTELVVVGLPPTVLEHADERHGSTDRRE
ncbi:MAG TPA: SulP family inorganic anion transporter [Enhygromyxa sp.]|nr:SulP family inorganic anion transporter [Enhygromyxa sp.]